ncbi:MAG: dTMP kinase [bacterium]
MQGTLINFEGVDFSGKSVQARLLHEQLTKLNIPVVLLREPGGTQISEKIRAVVLDKENHSMTAQAELLLYSAARTQMVSEEVIPNLEAGKVVICDRYYDSTLAYQGYGRGIDLDFIKKLNIFVTYGIKPDLTFLVDLAPEVALQRNEAKARALDRLEQEEMEFHHRVRQGYLEMANSPPDKARFVVIDGAQSVEAIQKKIFEIVKKRLA